VSVGGGGLEKLRRGRGLNFGGRCRRRLPWLTTPLPSTCSCLFRHQRLLFREGRRAPPSPDPALPVMLSRLCQQRRKDGPVCLGMPASSRLPVAPSHRCEACFIRFLRPRDHGPGGDEVWYAPSFTRNEAYVARLSVMRWPWVSCEHDAIGSLACCSGYLHAKMIMCISPQQRRLA
jgi:hypothetical protein